MARCKRCGRSLVGKESIERGYGPTCYMKRNKGFKYQIELRFNPKLTGTEKEKYEMVTKILARKD